MEMFSHEEFSPALEGVEAGHAVIPGVCRTPMEYSLLPTTKGRARRALHALRKGTDLEPEAVAQLLEFPAWVTEFIRTHYDLAKYGPATVASITSFIVECECTNRIGAGTDSFG